MGPSQEPSTHDLFAERRARRPEGEDSALIRRAEAAEAAVGGLEAHLSTLERRLEEIARERERLVEHLAEREVEVRNVKQREYAEQQLRVEAESRAQSLQRETHAHIEELRRRLGEAERRGRELGAELEAVRRGLSEAHQEMGLERRELERVRERDTRLVPIVRELMGLIARLRDVFARELAALRAELMRQSSTEREAYALDMTAMGAQIHSLRAELTAAVAELRERIESERPACADASTEPQPDEAEALRRQEMSEALAAAVERLRARAAELALTPADRLQPMPADQSQPAPADQPSSAAEQQPMSAQSPSAPERKMSLFARWRSRRRQRRAQ